MYHLHNVFCSNGPYVRREPWDAIVVGVGGTGAFVAESLCRLLPKSTGIVLVDLDRVEEQNLTRQNFFQDEIGKFKSEALAERLSNKYDRLIGYSTYPIAQTNLTGRSLLIGCVDNGLARIDIADRMNNSTTWWVDVGNGENYGQILIGNSDHAEFSNDTQTCFRLPHALFQRPELRLQLPPTPQLACEEVAADQGPTINQVMASLTIEVVRRLVLGTCPWMQLLVDMEHGTMTSVMADPGIIKRMFKTKRKDLVVMH
jgi:hypothetical protein